MFRTLLIWVFLVPMLSGASEDGIQRGGAAYIARSVARPSNTTLGQTGRLNPSGKPLLTSSTTEKTITSLFDLSATEAFTEGTETGAMSQASLTEFLVRSPISISGTVLSVTTESHCASEGPEIFGRTTLPTLFVQGIEQSVNGATNQVIELPDGLGRVIVNEQIAMMGIINSRIQVNGIHVKLTSGQDIILGHAEAEVRCGDPVSTLSLLHLFQ